jgi:peptide deformylase
VAVRKVVTLGNPILRQKAKKIHRVDESIQKLVDDLVETLHFANGAGLAAPQIGIPLRAIVTLYDDNLRVLLNPEIVDLSGEDIEGDEGCLSIPGWYGPVMRKERVTVRGLSGTGKSLKVKTEGWEARILQHEIDHLNGTLYIDRITDRSRLQKVETQEEEDELEEEQAIV